MQTRTPDDLGRFDPSGEEELVEGRSWWRSFSRRQVVGALIAVGLVVAVIAAGHTGSGQPAAAPTPTGTTSSDQSFVHFRPLSLNDIALHCPPTIACTSQENVPDQTLAAVHEFLPGAFERRTLTIDRIAPNRLYYRAVNATSGLVELLVIVSTPDKPRGTDGVMLDPHPGAAIRYARVDVGRYEIQVQYTGPPGGTPALELAQRLAADPRLLLDR